MSRKPIPDVNEQQQKFADYYIQNNLMDAYRCAIKAGYSKYYAKHASKKLCENVRIKHYILTVTGTIQNRDWRDKVRDQRAINNLYKMATGSTKKSHYKLHDLKHPEESTDQIMIGPTASREQVNALDLFLKYKGLEYSSSKQLEDAKSAKERAEAKADQVKSIYSEKLYKLKNQLLVYKVRKTKAESQIKEIVAKENSTNKNQTVSKLEQVLNAIFHNDDENNQKS